MFKNSASNYRVVFGRVFFFALAAAVGYYVWRGVPSLEMQRTLASNLGFFLLINLNIIVVMILAFLVVKNIIRLVLDRRNKILGSRLRSRLVAAFVGLSLIPTVLLFMVAKGMLERVLQGWFSPQIASSVDGAVAVARYHYDSAEAQIYRHTHYLARKVAELYPYLQEPNGLKLDVDKPKVKELLAGYLNEKREEYGLLSLELFEVSGIRVCAAESLQLRHHAVEMPGPNTAALNEAAGGGIIVRAEQSLDSEFLRGYAPISVSATGGLSRSAVAQASSIKHDRDLDSTSELVSPPALYVLVTTLWVSPELSASLAAVINAYDDYKELRTFSRPLVSSYLLTLVVVTLLIIFGAIWVGFYLARGLSIPIGLLAEGTRQVAHGNLEHQIPEVGDDELSELVRYFNMMTLDLKETTGELVSRRRYMETVLAGVGVGVVSVDLALRITTLNIAAADMIGLASAISVLGSDFRKVMPGELVGVVEKMLARLYTGSDKIISDNVSLELSTGSKHLQITVTRLSNEKKVTLGAVILLDNITELVSAQRMAAWREVARRIAHEIKNPLTPIQLNAERLQRRFARLSGVEGGRGEASKRNSIAEADHSIIAEATEVIIKQVSNLRTLVNEFSNFARMPKSNPRPGSINEVIREAVAVFYETKEHVALEFNLDPSIPLFSFDQEQMNRVIINLVSNALAAARLMADGPNGGQGVIAIESAYDDSLGLVSISVADNGPGINERDLQKIFEPYYTTKRGGTGLGLTIVSTIVEDHNGFIRVRKNEPHGAVFVVELPVSRAVSR